MNIIKQVRAPVRIDFAGGTTDIYPFTHLYGGAVLNAAINRYVTGKIVKTDEKVHLEYTGHTPTSSGLGTSGVMNLVWLALISQIKMHKKGGVIFKDKIELAEKVYALEQSMGLVGGKQDQYAAALGGINFLEFNKDEVKITPLNLSKALIRKLEENLMLVYTGKPHFSGTPNGAAIQNLKKGKNVKEMLRIKEIAVEMKNALLRGSLEMFSLLMNKETEARKMLDKATIPPATEKIIREGMRHGASAAKICGSGGGGSILFFGDKSRLKRKFGKRVIEFKFDFEGLKWI
jgi:D-glycero-alpha-D-manno-heptose-7-phosphate kinase